MVQSFDETICAPATLPGTGAVSLIRLSGPKALETADKVLVCRNGDVASTPGYRMKFASIDGPDGKLLDEVVACVYHAPHSYTGEDSVEITCHASAYIVDCILQKLCAAGARMALPGEFTQRAFVNGRMDLAQAEAVADVIAAQSAAAHRIAMNQLKGGFSAELSEMRAEMLRLVSLLELELDFSEEEVEFADRTALLELVDATSAHVQRLVESFRLGNAIKNGIPVAIVGPVNAGKSTLLNALIGEDRAIVSDIAGTTRASIEATLNLGGQMFRFIDTAGLRDTEETIEKIGIERSYKALEKADIVLAVFDAKTDAATLEEEFYDICSHIDFERQRLVPVLNKIDLLGAAESCSYDEKLTVNTFVNLSNGFVTNADGKGVASVIRISAATGAGMDKLREFLSDYAAETSRRSDGTLVTNLRHLEALKSAGASLARVREGLTTSLPTDLVAQDLRESLYHIGSIVGEISTDEVLGEIFGKFCIGK